MPARKRPQLAHAAEALRPGTAEQFQQHCFDLVVAVMCEYQVFAIVEFGRQRGVAGLARSGFEAVATTTFNLHR